MTKHYSWLDGLSHPGMRERYLTAFDRIAIDSLNGDKYRTGKTTPEGRPDPSIFSTDYNREGIQVGTAVTLLVRQDDHAPAETVRLSRMPRSRKSRRASCIPRGGLEASIVLGLVDVLFAAFVLVQTRYLFGGASFVASAQSMTLAEYARRGFFELVAVVALALPVLLLLRRFTHAAAPLAPRRPHRLARAQPGVPHGPPSGSRTRRAARRACRMSSVRRRLSFDLTPPQRPRSSRPIRRGAANAQTRASATPCSGSPARTRRAGRTR